MLSKLNAARNREDGFTLIELLIVVIIIGILAAIALPIFIDQQKVAIDASVKSDVRNTVTNVTNVQAQQDVSAFKVAHSKGNTVEVRGADGALLASAKGSSATAVDKDLAAPIALGSAYTVEGYNAGGKQYRGPDATGPNVYKFSAATGQFSQAVDAVTAAGPVVVASTGFEGSGDTLTVTDLRDSTELSSDAYRGSKSLAFKDPNSSDGGFVYLTYPAGSLTVGKNYELRFYAKVPANADANVLRVGEEGSGTPATSVYPGDSFKTWREIVVPFTHSSNSSKLFIEGLFGHGTSVNLFDDMRIVEAK